MCVRVCVRLCVCVCVVVVVVFYCFQGVCLWECLSVAVYIIHSTFHCTGFCDDFFVLVIMYNAVSSSFFTI